MRKLLEVDFIREVYCPKWLANIVMVKKANGKWRMCVDFINLNKACPRDSYLLLCIELLMDSMAGHQLLSFMDAFFGYNQIRLDEKNQEKTSFVMSQGLFCYKVLPFGLKNMGATYQRLVNKMFTVMSFRLKYAGATYQRLVNKMFSHAVRTEKCRGDIPKACE